MAFLIAGPAAISERTQGNALCSKLKPSNTRGRMSRTLRHHTRSKMCTTSASPSATSTTQEVIETGRIISENGELVPEVGVSVVGVFAIIDEENVTRHVGISRDVATSLARCLVRQPELAHGYRLKRFNRPSRAALEELRSEWASTASDPPTDWEAINVMTDTRVSQSAIDKINAAESGSERSRALKSACREVQKIIEEQLKQRGLTQRIQFAPKSKEKGILDVASVKIAIPDAI